MADTPKGSWPAPARPAVPPKPTSPPVNGGPKKVVTKTRNGGGLNPSVNVSVNKTTTTNTNVTTGARGGHSPLDTLRTAELSDQEALHAFCEAGRRLGRELAIYLGCAEEELYQGLRELDGGKWALFGFDSRVRAGRVTRHLVHATEAAQVMAGHMAAAWIAFEKEFAEPLEVAQIQPKKRGFEIR